MEQTIEISPSEGGTNFYVKSPSVVELENGDLKVVWYDQDGGTNRSDILTQTFDSNGNPIGSPQVLHSDVLEHSYVESKALVDGGSIIVFIDAYRTDPAAYHVYTQTFNADGTERSDLLQVDQSEIKTLTSFGQILSSTVLENGNIVLAWMTVPVDGDYHTLGDVDTMIRIIAPDGTPVTDEMRVHADAAGEQASPHVVAMPDGSFMVTWASYTTATTQGDIRSKRFNADGTEYSGALDPLDEDSVITIDVLDNDSDPDKDELTITNIQGKSVAADAVVNIVDSDGVTVIGTARVVAGGIEFTPGDELDKLAEGERKSISFSYTISDRGHTADGLEDEATVTLNIVGTNDAPTIEFSQDNVTRGDVAVVIGNISDIDSDIDFSKSTASAKSGTVTIDQSNGDILYTTKGTASKDTITITAFDEEGEQTKSTHTLKVKADTNGAPVAVNDDYRTSGSPDSTDITDSIDYSNFSGTEENFDSVKLTASDYEVHGSGTNEYAGATVHMLGDEGKFALVYIDAIGTERVYKVQRFNADGSKKGGVITLNDETSSDQSHLGLDLTAIGNDGAFAVQFMSRNDSGDHQFHQQFDKNGNRTLSVNIKESTSDSIYIIGGVSKQIDDDGSYVVVWHDSTYSGHNHQQSKVYVRTYNKDGDVTNDQVVDSPAAAGGRFNSNTKVITFDDGTFIVQWNSTNDFIPGTTDFENDHSNGNDLYMQRFNASGSPIGGVKSHMNMGENFSYDPMDTLAIGGTNKFAAVWIDEREDDNADRRLMFRTFNKDGDSVTGVQTLTVPHGHPVKSGSVSLGESGKFAIMYAGKAKSSDDELQIYVQIVGTNGRASGQPISVSKLKLNEDYEYDFYFEDKQGDSMAITALNDAGDFVVSWTGIEKGDNNTAVFNQVYNASGKPQGNVFVVDGDGDKSVTRIESVAAGDGSFIVTFNEGDKQYAHRLTADGKPWKGYIPGEEGSYDIKIDSSGLSDVVGYRVTYSTGSLVANGKTYASGKEISLANWKNVKLNGVEGGQYDLEVEAIQVVGELFDEDAVHTFDVLANDSDPDGDKLVITQISGNDATGGNVVEVKSGKTVIGTAQVVKGKIKFTPGDELDKLAQGQTKSYTFNYRIEDGKGGADTANVSFTAVGTNDAPDIEFSLSSVTRDNKAVVIGNISDIDSSIDFARTTTSANNGTVSIHAKTGNILYTANSNAKKDTITINAWDEEGAKTQSTHKITVKAPVDLNTAPDATNDVVGGSSEDVSASFTASGFTGQSSNTHHLKGLNTAESANGDVRITALGDQGEFAISWAGSDAQGDNSIYVQKFDASGAKTGKMTHLEASDTNTRTDSHAQIHAVGDQGDYLVVWSGIDGNGDWSVFTQRFDSTGAKDGKTIKIEAEGSTGGHDLRPQVISLNDKGDYVIAWDGEQTHISNSIYTQRFSAAGKKIGGQTKLDGLSSFAADDSDWRAELAALGDNGAYVVTWYGHDTDGDQAIFIQRFDDNGQKQGGVITLDASVHRDTNPDVTAIGDDGAFAVAWTALTANRQGFDIYTQRYNANGSLDGGKVKLDTSHSTAEIYNTQIIPVGDNGSYVVVWNAADSSNNWSVFTQQFNANGSRQGATHEIEGVYSSDLNVLEPQVAALDGGGYVVTTYGKNQSGVSAVYLQKFNPNGSKDGNVEIFGESGLEHFSPRVEGLGGDDGYVVAWRAYDRSTQGGTIHVQKTNADGTKVSAIYEPGSVGDFDISTSMSAKSGEFYTVSYSTGTLVVNGVTYDSGSTIAAADWKNVKLKNAVGSDYDLQVEKTIGVSENSTLRVDVLDNDSDADRDKLTISEVDGKDVSGGKTVNVTTKKGAVIGTAKIVGGDIEFTPGAEIKKLDPGEAKEFSFNYTVSDGKGGEDQASVTFTAVGSNSSKTPLILDLDGDGIETVALAAGVTFDLDADGDLDSVGWVGKDDALLVRDINRDGVINDGAELFGDSTKRSDGTAARDGYQALAELDSNQDGVINADDAAFEELRVWQDSNGDGLSDAAELKRLSEVGITELSLDAQHTSESNNGNVIGLQSHYTSTDGTQGQMADVWLSYEDSTEDDFASEATDKLNSQPAEASFAEASERFNILDEGDRDIFVFHEDAINQMGQPHFEVIDSFDQDKGDTLDLSEVLQLQGDIDLHSLDQYLHFEQDGNATKILVNSQGAFSDGGGSVDKAEQVITLQGTDLVGNYASDQEIIDHLIDNKMLIVSDS
ncbi:MAG: Ig-like domain-containing protein [Pseudomonadales bacterium]